MLRWTGQNVRFRDSAWVSQWMLKLCSSSSSIAASRVLKNIHLQ